MPRSKIPHTLRARLEETLRHLDTSHADHRACKEITAMLNEQRLSLFLKTWVIPAIEDTLKWSDGGVVIDRNGYPHARIPTTIERKP